MTAPAAGAETEVSPDVGAEPARAVRCEMRDGVAVVSLTRPGARNTVNVALAADLRQVAQRLTGDSRVRAVLLRAEGPTFCAGGDVGLFASTPPDELPGVLGPMVDDYHQAIDLLTRLDAPIVLAARGAVAGGGLGLLYCADLVVAARDTKFALGYTGLGLSVDGGASWFLPRLVGLRRAQELCLLNAQFGAQEAQQWGLVSFVTEPEEAEDRAAELARRLADGPTAAYASIRSLLRTSFGTGLTEQLAAERVRIVDTAATDDVREGVRAFAERRSARFLGH